MTIGVWGPSFALLALVSLADDVRALPVALRLAVHVLAAAILAYSLAPGGDGTRDGFVAAPVVIALVVLWSLNLYNFMDGSDGLAALMGVVGFAAYAVAAQCAGANAVLFWALAAGLLPLLWVNRPPARLFLGDIGAVPLGFLAAAFGVGGFFGNLWPAWFAPLVFLPFITDATITLIQRFVRAERVWEAHRGHYYQRLHQLGAGHRGTLAVFGALMGGTASTAVACACLQPLWGPPALVAWCIVCALVFATIDYHWRRRTITTS